MRNTPSPRKRRGSAIAMTLIVALMLAAVGASLVALTTSVRRVTEANHSYQALQTVLERGVDQAMHAFGKYREGGFNSAAWPAGWKQTGATGYSKDFGEVDLGNNRKSRLRVTIQNLPLNNTDALELNKSPYIVADAGMSGKDASGSSAYSRQILVTLKRVQVNGTGQGLVSQNTLTFIGNGSKVDSYSSSFPGILVLYPYGAKLPDGTLNISDKVTVGTVAIAKDGFDPLSANAGGIIYGSVLIGGGSEAALDKAVSGMYVGVYDPAVTSPKAGVDPDRTSTGFSADFTVPKLPADYNASTASPLPAADKSGNITIGSLTATSPQYYKVTDLKLTKGSLIVRGPVVLVADSISTSGNGQITVDNSTGKKVSSLTMFVSGDVSLTGNGIVNSGAGGAESTMTTQVTLNGTNTNKNDLQDIKIAGNGAFSGVIDAPFASFVMGGGGSSGVFFGSVKAFNISINGGGLFHYDLALAAVPTVDAKYPVDFWIEPQNKADMAKYGL